MSDDTPTPNCMCGRCIDLCREMYPGTAFPTEMILCPLCGNKRCPHASNHRFACTRSNLPGQEGSLYQRPASEPIGPKPPSERLQVIWTGNQLRVAAVLVDAKEVDRLVRILNANKELLADPDTPIANG